MQTHLLTTNDDPLESSLQVPYKTQLAMEQRLRERLCRPRKFKPFLFTGFLQHGENAGGSEPVTLRARYLLGHRKSRPNEVIIHWTFSPQPLRAGIQPRVEVWTVDREGTPLTKKVTHPGGATRLRSSATPTPFC